MRLAFWLAFTGCYSLPPGDGIRGNVPIPILPATATPATLPAPPVRQESPPADVAVLPVPRVLRQDSVLSLEQVLASVSRHFPLLLAVEQERAITAGNRLAAEGAFDLNLRTRGVTQGGTFPNERFDLLLDQPTALNGISVFSGYRFGFGDFPVYYGDRQTADGGEFRAGMTLPLLRDGPIDRRRAALRQARITEALADPAIRRARIDYARAAARAYWNWVAAGEQCRIASALLAIAQNRQSGFEEQNQRGQIAEFIVIDNRRVIAEREGGLIAAERRFQQTALDLSLFLRDEAGEPVIPQASALPAEFARDVPAEPCDEPIAADVETAFRQRPELQRMQLLKERVATDLRLFENQTYPYLGAGVTASQDVGPGKQSTGILALDRSNIEASLLLDVPLQRRDALGKAQAARAALAQVSAQERFARDQIRAEVQDAISNLARSFERLQRARQEQSIAERVADLERERFRAGQSNLLEVNIRELSAAGARAKVVDVLADFYRAQADYRAALGVDFPPPTP
jgi:outer membrane protein TolC